MRNKAVMAVVFLVLPLIASQILLGIQVWKCRVSVESLASRLDGYKEQSDLQKCRDSVEALASMFDEYKERADLQHENLEKEIQSLSDIQKSGVAGIKKSLDLLNEKSDLQINLTDGLKKTYDDLFEEQRKKTLDTTSQDTAIARIKNEAERLYSEKNYASAYKEFVKVLSYQNDDMESRLKKMKSLYYRNRTDSSKYSEILEDIRILRLNGCLDKEAAEIERIVTAERGGGE